MSLRRFMADDSGACSLGAWARRRRSQRLLATFPQLHAMSVLDLGGTQDFWQAAPVKPASVVLLNRFPQTSEEPWIQSVTGDACEPPARIRAQRFDLVFSNSTIEHVGGHVRRQQFAETVMAAAPRAWIQTPNRYFPVEPHWLLPAGQFLPAGVRATLVRHWPLRPSGFPADPRTALREMIEIDLLSRAQLAWYFPGATILSERVLGIPKSLIAVVGGGRAAAAGGNEPDAPG